MKLERLLFHCFVINNVNKLINCKCEYIMAFIIRKKNYDACNNLLTKSTIAWGG